MKLLGMLVLLVMPFASMAQRTEIEWKYSIEYSSACEAALVFTAVTGPGWHLYSQENPPYPLAFEFDGNTGFRRIGNVTEPLPYKESDEYLGPVAYFKSNEVVFRQKIKILTDAGIKISGAVYGQLCSDEGVCIPLKATFIFNLQPAGKECAGN